MENGTWELAQLPPGRWAIGSHWVFKVKWKLDSSIDKYKGWIVAQGFSQVRGIHYNKVFTSTAHMAVMQSVIALAGRRISSSIPWMSQPLSLMVRLTWKFI